MALETDLSTITVVSSDTNPINEVIETPATSSTPPIDLPNTIVIAQGFMAGTIDGENPGFSGMIGSGLASPGFFGVNDEHKLTYFLASQSFDYSSSALPEIGKAEAGELRLGDDVSADRYGTLTGSSYLRYVPSTGLHIHNSAITISGSSGSIWVGDVQIDGTPDITGSGCGILDIGYYAVNSGVPTFRLLSTGNLFAVGDNISQDTVTGEFLGSKYLAYTADRGLELQGSNISVNNSGFVWVGDDLGAYVRGETTILPDGVGLIHNLDVNGTSTSGIIAMHNQQVKFAVAENTGNVYMLDGAINVGTDGFVWVGDQTSASPDFTGSGVGMWSDGFGGLSNGSYTFFISQNSGRFAFGENVDKNNIKTDKGIYFDEYSNIVCENISVLLPSGGCVWVGSTTSEHGIDLTGTGVGIWNIGLAAIHSGSATFYIDATSGHFAFGENVNLTSVSTTKGVAYNGTNLTLNNIDLINKDSSDNTTVEITSDGDLTLGSDVAHQLKYTASDGNLTIDGAQVGVNNDAYVWVGDTDFTNGCGMIGGSSTVNDGFYCGHSGIMTVYISAVDGTFRFGKTSGPHIQYDGTDLALFDTNINVTGGYVWAGVGTPGVGTGVGLVYSGFYAFNGTTQTAFISASDGSFKLGTTNHCIEFNGTDTLSLTGVDTVISSGHYVWVGTPITQGCGICDAGIYGTDASGNQTVLINASDGSFKLGGDYYLALSASGKLTLKISDYASDFVATNAPEANATVGAKAGTNVFASSGSVLHDSDIVTTQGTANNAQNYTGNSIQTIFTDAKCTDPNADQTSANTAYNTSHVNSSITDGGNSYIVSNGDIKMYSDHDIKFYHGAGSYLTGSINASSYALDIDTRASYTDVRLLSGRRVVITSGNVMGTTSASDTISLLATGGVYCYGTLHPWSNGSYDLGDSGTKWGTVYANYLGASSYKINSVYATYVGIYNSKISYVFTTSLGNSSYPTNYIYTSHLNVSGNNVTMGTSSNYFKIHIYNGGWASYPCYITQS